MRLRYAFFLATCLLPFLAQAQVVDYEVPDYFVNRVKTLDDFINKFNRRTATSFLDTADTDYAEKQIVSLFCFDSVANRREEVLEFARCIVDSNARLAFSKPNYYCEILCRASYMNFPTKVKLRLMVEYSPDSSYLMWSIVDAEGPMLKVAPNRLSNYTHLSPVDNDRSFLDLRYAFNETPEDISAYAHSAWKPDELSVFLTLVQKRLMKVENIEDMQYVFNEAGYTFWVKRIDRKTNNNGWLIYDFQKNY